MVALTAVPLRLSCARRCAGGRQVELVVPHAQQGQRGAGEADCGDQEADALGERAGDEGMGETADGQGDPHPGRCGAAAPQGDAQQGALTAVLIGAYLGIVAGLSALAQHRLSATPVIATAVIAVAFAPARSAVQSAVDRLMYGQRRDPAVAAARVGRRLGTGLDGVLRAVCEALRLPYAAISSGGRLEAAHGSQPAILHTSRWRFPTGPRPIFWSDFGPVRAGCPPPTGAPWTC